MPEGYSPNANLMLLWTTLLRTDWSSFYNLYDLLFLQIPQPEVCARADLQTWPWQNEETAHCPHRQRSGGEGSWYGNVDTLFTDYLGICMYCCYKAHTVSKAEPQFNVLLY